jgi:plasmid replication initiation protein
VKKAVKKIAQNTITLFEDEEHLDVLNWLQSGKYDGVNDFVQLIFTDKIGKLFVRCRDRFSLINLKTIGGLKSYFAMRYYEIALSYRGFAGKGENAPKTWYFEYSLDDIRNMFKVDTNAYENRNNAFIIKVITQPLAELNKHNADFTITAEKQVDPIDRRRAVGFKFTCKMCGAGRSKKKLLATDTSTQKLIKRVENERIEAENDFEPIEKMKMLFPDEFKQRLQARRAGNPLEIERLAENEVYTEMLAAGYGLDGKQPKASKQKEPTAKEKKTGTKTTAVEVPKKKDKASPEKPKALENDNLTLF